MGVGKIASKEALTEALKDSGQRLVVLLFSTTWCEFCRMIDLHVGHFSTVFPDVSFFEVDVNKAQEVVTHCSVRWYPTFQFYKKGSKVFEFKGPNKQLLGDTIKKFHGPA